MSLVKKINILVNFILCIFYIGTFNAFAQPQFNSPYSKYGLGEIQDVYFAQGIGLGRLGASTRDYNHLNVVNPASFGFLKTSTFEMGLYGSYTNSTISSQQANVWGGNLSYIAIGVPTKNQISQFIDKKKSPYSWGLGFSLQPYSSVGYDISINDSSDTTLGTINHRFQGGGGAYRLMMSNGVKYKNFALGLNLGYLFGELNESYIFSYSDQTNTYTYYDNTLNDLALSGLTYNLGAMYDYQLKTKDKDGKKVASNKHFVFGATWGSKQKIGVNNDYLFTRERILSSSVQDKDTIAIRENAKYKATLPSEWSIGTQFEIENKLRVGINYSGSQWSDYVNPAKLDTLNNAFNFSVGVEYTPNYISYNNYLEKIRYRLSYNYGKDPRIIKGESLTRTSATIGFGFPIILPRQQTSFINLSVEAGQYKTPTNINDKFIKATIGFTMNDNSWFYKRRYN